MDPKDCIFFQLSRVSRAGARYWHKVVADYGVTSAQALVLLCLALEDRITARQLGAKIEFDSATLTGLVDRLTKAGLVERQNNPRDRRAIFICLTPEGRDTATRLETLIEPANQAFLSALTPEEALILRALLKKITPDG